MASSATTVAKQVQRKLYTLVLVLDNAVPRRVLLGMKKRGFGAGKRSRWEAQFWLLALTLVVTCWCKQGDSMALVAR